MQQVFHIYFMSSIKQSFGLNFILIEMSTIYEILFLKFRKFSHRTFFICLFICLFVHWRRYCMIDHILINLVNNTIILFEKFIKLLNLTSIQTLSRPKLLHDDGSKGVLVCSLPSVQKGKCLFHNLTISKKMRVMHTLHPNSHQIYY